MDQQPTGWDLPSPRVSALVRSSTPPIVPHPFGDEFPSVLCWTDDDDNPVRVAAWGLSSSSVYYRGSEIGAGGFGRVYKVLKMPERMLYAGKWSSDGRRIDEEARKLRRLNHEHVLKYIELCDTGTDGTMLLVTELCGGGDLNTLINNSSPRGLEPGKSLRVIQQVASALNYIHGAGLFHSDVKPRNIIIRSLERMDVVLGDCADLKTTKSRRPDEHLGGTREFHSPEMVQSQHHTGPPDDVWALGIVTLAMMAQLPRVQYTREGSRDIRQINLYPGQCKEHARRLMELNPASGIVKLTVRMLEEGPGERIKAGELGDSAGEEMKRLDEGQDGEAGSQIKVPEAFQAIEFW